MLSTACSTCRQASCKFEAFVVEGNEAATSAFFSLPSFGFHLHVIRCGLPFCFFLDGLAPRAVKLSSKWTDLWSIPTPIYSLAYAFLTQEDRRENIRKKSICLLLFPFLCVHSCSESFSNIVFGTTSYCEVAHRANHFPLSFLCPIPYNPMLFGSSSSCPDSSTAFLSPNMMQAQFLLRAASTNQGTAKTQPTHN